VTAELKQIIGRLLQITGHWVGNMNSSVKLSSHQTDKDFYLMVICST